MKAYQLMRPLLFKLPPETAHNVIYSILKHVLKGPVKDLSTRYLCIEDERLQVNLLGNTFPNPVGVAAGFDKKGAIPGELSSLGFGHVEIGAVTAKPQDGNARPRMFRLVKDQAIINRMGFNNEGADHVADRLQHQTKLNTLVGINIGMSESTDIENAEKDYIYTYRRVSDYGDYFVVNVSCPNLPGLRNLQQGDYLRSILYSLQEEGASPLLVKFSPDMTTNELADALEAVNEVGVDGIIATNTSDKRPDSLESPNRNEIGGLSGKPIEKNATETIRCIAKSTNIPIIGVGGVFTAEDAYEKIRAGASLVQLYTGLVYRGPSIAHDINSGLIDLLNQDGFDSIEEAVGADIRDETQQNTNVNTFPQVGDLSAEDDTKANCDENTEKPEVFLDD